MTGYLVELKDMNGRVFDSTTVSSLDEVIPWASYRGSTSRIFIDGEKLMWNILVGEGTITISSVLDTFEVTDIPGCDIWQCVQVYDEENGTDLYDLLDDSNMVWEGY